ncbi:hypothetical protein LCGC14_1833180 [marine sediment metagenome]|uniref:Uncharacterized protein n=1 Tax=marine sediment metagenome TaxID=412755 RepID=A0A0F9IUZ5_9ZZZZ
MKAPKKPTTMNGDHSNLWDMMAHLNTRIDNIYKWGFVAVVIIIASQWGSTAILKVLGVE